MQLSKELVLKSFLEKFNTEHASLIQSARAAHLAATHEESKAEDRHDTFAIEASYLAAGQATRVAELERTLQEFETYLSGTGNPDQVTLGKLITYESERIISHVFFAVLGGGCKIQIASHSVQVLSIQSPLGEELQNAKVGDTIIFELRGIEKLYKILAIQ